MRLAAIPFVVAGLAPSFVALVTGGGMIAAMWERAAIGEALGARGQVATLSPQFVADPDPRFAAGPFAFRIRRFLSPEDEAARRIVTPRTLAAQFAARPPGAILVGGEGRWTSGTDGADAPLEAWARSNGWQQVPLASRRFRLWVP
jgi:hypothetical protein